MDSFLVDDDHETWCLLSSGNNGVALNGLEQRFEQDHLSSDFWQQLTTTAESLGFAVQSTSHPTTSPPALANTLPVAFDTSSGKKHVDSLCKLLQTDEKRVVQLTFGALQDVDQQHLQSLLGTRSLFLKVLNFQCRQRSARLGIVTELLRGNSDNDVLDSLDQQVLLGGAPRGVLQKLLFAACAPELPPTRNQVLPLKDLGDEFFVQQVLQVQSEQRLLEREQAMEALLALLYARLSVTCTDFCLILLALQSCGEFFSAHSRLAHLAGLLCAEAVNLNNAGPNHIMLTPDLKLITNILMNFSDQAFKRREGAKVGMIVAAPESIAMLAMGLLLKITQQGDAMECLELANNCGAFEYLQNCFDNLLPSQASFLLGAYQDTPGYDWQFSDSIPTLSIENDTQVPDMAANLVIYTSVGLELLNSVVSALGEFMGSPENLQALCHLGATLYANQPILCEEFWRQPGSVGTLVEAAFGKTMSVWEILASLCFDRDSVNRVMTMMPQDYLLESLSTPTDTALVLSAISKMAQFEPSAIRQALHDDPGALFRILSMHPSDDVVLEKILNLLSSLLQDCPSWAVTAVKFFGARSSHDLLSRCFGSEKTSAVAARVLQSLVEVMSVVCFKYAELEILEYLSVTVKASIAACHSLSTIFSFSSQPTVSYSNAYLVLKASSSLVMILRQLSLHTFIKVREAALEARAAMLEAFSTSTSFGQALSYFAGAPVSLSIGLLLEKTLQEASLLQLATEEYAVDDATNPMGKWHGVLQKATESPIIKLVRERLGDCNNVRIDLAAIHHRGWSDGESGPIHAAAAALSLLKEWSMEAEDFMLTKLVQKDFLANASPFKLLHSAATMPPVVRASSKLAYLWPACGLSTCDLLVHFVTSTKDTSLPFYDSLALLALSAAHANYCGGLVGKVFNVTSPLYTSMKAGITEAAALVSGRADNDEPEAVIQKGIKFVKLLGNILGVNLAQGVSLLGHDASAIGNALVESVKGVVSGPANQRSDRFAAESMAILRLAKQTNEIIPDLVALATISRPPSIIRTELVAQSLEILSQSVLAGDDPAGVQAIFSNPAFHEQPVHQFRDCVILMCRAMSRFESIAAPLKSCLNLSNPSLFLQSFPSGDTRTPLDITGLNQYDIKSTATIIYSLNKENSDAAQVASATEGMFICMVSVKKQVGAVEAWAKLVQAWTSSNDRNTPSDLLKGIEVVLVDKMHELAELKTEVEKEVATLADEIEAVLEVASNLLLSLISLRSADLSLDHIALQKLVDTIEIVSVRAGTSPTRSTLLNNLLAAAAVVLRGSSTGVDMARFVPIIRQALTVRDDPEILQTALLLLAAVIHSKELAEDRRSRAKFANAMSETGIVSALVDEVSIASARAIKDKDNFDVDQVTTVMSLFTVLLALSNAGMQEASFLSLFARSNLSKMLLSNPLFAQAIPRWTASGADSHYRGYIKSSSKRSNEGGMERVAIFLSGRSDPVHKVWRLGIRLVTSLLRVSSMHGRDRDFQQLALDFVRENDGILRSCLEKCCAVGHSSVLTHNLVDEADEILALLSELSTKSGGFLEIAVSLVGSLCKFLGSIGTSRFLFKLVRDVEAANQEQDSPFDNLQELHPALSGGVGNARFEAIRYAHYARSAYAMVTSEDNQQFSNERGYAPSGNELEEICYKAINNAFCGEIEVAVAYCLTNALTLLSKTHPAARSFVLFSKEESRRLNPFAVVKVGAIIAAHSENALKFARVVSSDTVRRSWKCTMVDPETTEAADEEVTISVDDLAGVEDVMKRLNLFHYLAAPDSATHMETAEYRNSSNVGHLILTLQWCRQGEIWLDAEIRTNLAESASALLATELALHREIGTDKLANDSVRKNVNDQLFDLFDNGSKFPELNACIGPDFLQRIRGQLKVPLEVARKERVEKRQIYEERLAAMNASNPWR